MFNSPQTFFGPSSAPIDEKNQLLQAYLQAHDLKNSDVIIFPSEEYEWVSNRYPAEIDIDGRTWTSTESYMQAQKLLFVDLTKLKTEDKEILEKLIQELLNRPDAATAVNLTAEKRFSNNQSLNDLLDEKWHSAEGKKSVLLKANQAKYSQHPDLSEKLLMTQNKWFIALSTNANLHHWTIAKKGETFGLNWMGDILEQVRTELSLKMRPSSAP